MTSTHNVSGIDGLRMMLGHPLPVTHPICCMIVSGNGMDSATLPDRIIVAARLWCEGISAEYIPQSGVMMSLLRRKPSDAQKIDSSSSVSFIIHFGFSFIFLRLTVIFFVQP